MLHKSGTPREKGQASMIDRELKKLNRAELLELLLESTVRCESLQRELDRANAQLADRALAVEQCGSLAEAALRLGGVFAAADEAAALFRENVARLQSETEAACAARLAEAEEQAKAILAEAERQREAAESSASQTAVLSDEDIRIRWEDDA